MSVINFFRPCDMRRASPFRKQKDCTNITKIEALYAVQYATTPL